MMTTLVIRQKLHNYLEIADDKKVKAIYTILEDDIEESSIEYTEELKNELDKRFEDLKRGKAKAISANEKSFPYLIMYRINKKQNTITITSVFHMSRNPLKKYK